MSQIIGFLNKIHGFLSGLNIPDYILLALLVIILIWLFVTNQKVKRAVGIPFKVIDKQFKKKLEELDKEKAEVRKVVGEEVKKVNKSQKKLESQVEEEIQALKELRVEQEIQMKQEAGAKEDIGAEKRIRAQKESEEEEIKVEKEAPSVPPMEAAEGVRVEPERPVMEVQAEKDVEPEREAEKVEKEEIKVESKPEKGKESAEKPSRKEAAAKLTSEQFYILSAIGDEPDKTLQEDALFKVYQLAYPDLKKEDFDHQIKKLEKLGLVELERPSGYKVWVKITDEGLDQYRASAEEKPSV